MFSLGSRLGPYEIVSPLGKGGMGEVYRARDTRLERDVAIKILPRTFTNDADRVARFQREARVLASLNHPNIATIHGVEDADGAPAIVMELIEGETLGERLSRLSAKDRSLPLDETLVIARQVADALDAAHEKGIVHRDLKPANIAFTADGTVKVLDFGLAKIAGGAFADRDDSPTVTSEATSDGLIVGTVAYMSPEQARGHTVDKRTDIWAFGCVLYEMLTGRTPFRGATVSDTIAAILERDPAWGALPPVPIGLRRLAERCLEKDLKRRQRDIGDARRDLESVSEPTGPTAGNGRASSLTPWIIAAMAVAFGGVAWWTSAQNAQPAVRIAEPTLTRVTWDSGLSIEPALSPDGSLVVYASDAGGDGNLDLWVQRVAGGTPIRLTQDQADDREPAFSPDSLSIAFRSERSGGGVYVIPALGGDARLIAEGGRRPQFSPDGKDIAYWTGGTLGGARNANGSAIYIVPANGGTPQRLAKGFVNARNPIWAPDGRSLLFFGRKELPRRPPTTINASASSLAATDFDWWWLPRTGGEPVSTGVYPALTARGIVFAPASEIESLPQTWGEHGVLFSATLGQATNLWQVKISPATGKADAPPVRLTTGGGSDGGASIDRSGRIAFQVAESKESVFALALDANAAKSLNRIDRLTTDWNLQAHRGSISQDGRILADPRHRPNTSELWIKALDTGAERHLVTTLFTQLNPSVSPDGSLVAYTVTENDRDSGYVVPSAGGAARKMCDDCRMHGWLADSKNVLADYPTGHPRIRAIDSGSLQVADVFDTDATVQRVFGSGDNRWLAVGTPNVAWVAPLHPGRAATAAESVSITLPSSDLVGSRMSGWSPDGRLLYSLLGIDGFRCLYAQRIDATNHTPVGDPFIVQHFHDPQRAWGSTPMGNAITERGFVYDQLETSSSIWLLDPGPGER